jgi:hypothetical protein
MEINSSIKRKISKLKEQKKALEIAMILKILKRKLFLNKIMKTVAKQKSLRRKRKNLKKKMVKKKKREESKEFPKRMLYYLPY